MFEGYPATVACDSDNRAPKDAVFSDEIIGRSKEVHKELADINRCLYQFADRLQGGGRMTGSVTEEKEDTPQGFAPTISKTLTDQEQILADIRNTVARLKQFI